MNELAQIKAQAKRLRRLMADKGAVVGHSQALEIIADHYGYRDWNTLSAQLKKALPPVQPGETVNGLYSGQSFTARVRAVETVRLGFWQVRLQLVQPIDVVHSAHFSSFRHQLKATIDGQGKTQERLADGEPLLQLTRSTPT